MADLRIEQLPTALTLALADLVPLAAYDEQVETGYKASKITAAEIAAALLTTFEQSGLTTTSKTIVGAINEIASGGAGAAHVIAGSSDPTSAQGNDLDLYVKYATSGGVTSVTGLFVKLSGTWVSIATGGGSSAFIIEVTQSEQSYSIDKTAAEIDAAYSDGAAMFANLVYSNFARICELSIMESGTGYVRYTFQNTWSTGFIQILIITHGGTVEVSVTNASIPSINDNFVSPLYLWSSKKTKEYTDDAIVSILPTDTASGTIATFETSLTLPLVECKAQIVPTQEGSGDPSPSNVRPISGWTACNVTRAGANIWDEQWQEGYYDTAGIYHTGNYVCSKNPICILGGAAYFIVVPSGHTLYICFYDKDETFINRVSFSTSQGYVIPNNAAFLQFNMGGSYGTTYNNDISINYPNTDTEYHAYTGTTVTIDLDGTVYVGELDVKRGVLTITHTLYDMSALSWSKNGSTPTFYSGIVQGIKEQTADFYCTCYLPSVNGGYNAQNLKCSLRGETGQTRIWVCDNSFETAADYKASLTNQKIVLPKATPTEVTLTPEEITTLVGENNIWADTGDIEVEYKVSIKDYVDSKLASLGTRSASLTKAASVEGEKIENNETEGGENER